MTIQKCGSVPAEGYVKVQIKILDGQKCGEPQKKKKRWCSTTSGQSYPSASVLYTFHWPFEDNCNGLLTDLPGIAHHTSPLPGKNALSYAKNKLC